ncbi:MAG TPA: CU044_2847 family protein [Anaerolineales bacterium]|nr:CU044_2847 family protein [Anaerolineales bacterium]
MAEKVKEKDIEILVDFGEETGGLVPVSRGGGKLGEVTGELVEKSKEAIDKAMDTIQAMAAKTIAAAKGISEPPDAIEVEFGIKLDAAAGALVAQAGTEASINVKMVWRPKEKPMAKLPAVGFFRTAQKEDEGNGGDEGEEDDD